MLNVERTNYIYEEIRRRKIVYVEELAKRYYVSASTIRRDLREMEEAGVLRRIYGGAVLKEKQSIEIPYELRVDENKQEKEKICKLAAQLVEDEMHIFLDTTTTTSYLPKYLDGKNNIKIITNSAMITREGLESSNAQIYVTGGWFNRISRGFTGETAKQGIQEFYSDILFFSARAVSKEWGVMDVNQDDVYMKKIMIEKARKVVLLADHTKWELDSYLTVCKMNQVDVIVTDKQPSEEWLELLHNQNVQVMY